MFPFTDVAAAKHTETERSSQEAMGRFMTSDIC